MNNINSRYFKMYVFVSLLVLYFAITISYRDIYIADYSKMAVVIFTFGMLLRGVLKNLVNKFRDLEDIKHVFDPVEKYPIVEVQIAHHHELSRAQRRELERKEKKGTKDNEDYSIFIISLIIIVGIVVLLILSRMFPGIGQMIFKPGTFVAAVFVALLYGNYQEIFTITENMSSQRIKFKPALILLLFSIAIIVIALYYLPTHQNLIALLIMFSILNIWNFYIRGVRKPMTDKFKQISFVLDVMIAVLSVYGIFRIIGVFGFDYIQNFLLFGLLYWAICFAFNINSKYLYALSMILIILATGLHFIHLNTAEYIAVLTYYMLMMGVISDLFKNSLYIKELKE